MSGNGSFVLLLKSLVLPLAAQVKEMLHRLVACYCEEMV